MFSRRRKELCVAILVLTLCILCTAAALTSSSRSESRELLCFAITSLVSSWLISANEKARRESREMGGPSSTSAATMQPVLSMPSSPMAVARVEPAALVNAFSIDLEDYFHTEVASKTTAWGDWDHLPSRLENTVPRLLDLLDETDNRATVFVLGWVAEKYPALVRRIASRGHEIACHSYRHRAVFRLDPESFYEDTRKAKYITEDATGCVISGFRAPCFSITKGSEWAFDVLSELDFRYDSSVNPIHHGFYGNASSPSKPHCVGDSGLLEIPIAVWRFGGINLPVGGGAYLRLLPYAYNLAGLRHLNRVERRPATLYMHPWEMDAHQPDLHLPLLSHIRQTWGTSTMESRLHGMLKEFRFAPLAEVYSSEMTQRNTAAPVRCPHSSDCRGGLLVMSQRIAETLLRSFRDPRTFLIRRVTYPVWAPIATPGRKKYANLFDKTQTMSADSMQKHQSTHLRALLLHAYRHVPFYRRSMEDAGITPLDIQTPEDLVLLQPLTRWHIEHRHDDLTACNPQKRPEDPIGEFSTFDRRHRAVKAALINRYRQTAGLYPWMRYASIGEREDPGPARSGIGAFASLAETVIDRRIQFDLSADRKTRPSGATRGYCGSIGQTIL